MCELSIWNPVDTSGDLSLGATKGLLSYVLTVIVRSFQRYSRSKVGFCQGGTQLDTSRRREADVKHYRRVLTTELSALHNHWNPFRTATHRLCRRHPPRMVHARRFRSVKEQGIAVYSWYATLSHNHVSVHAGASWLGR